MLYDLLYNKTDIKMHYRYPSAIASRLVVMHCVIFINCGIVLDRDCASTLTLFLDKDQALAMVVIRKYDYVSVYLGVVKVISLIGCSLVCRSLLACFQRLTVCELENIERHLLL